jgi:hypothetical protein
MLIHWALCSDKTKESGYFSTGLGPLSQLSQIFSSFDKLLVHIAASLAVDLVFFK